SRSGVLFERRGLAAAGPRRTTQQQTNAKGTARCIGRNHPAAGRVGWQWDERPSTACTHSRNTIAEGRPGRTLQVPACFEPARMDLPTVPPLAGKCGVVSRLAPGVLPPIPAPSVTTVASPST